MAVDQMALGDAYCPLREPGNENSPVDESLSPASVCLTAFSGGDRGDRLLLVYALAAALLPRLSMESEKSTGSGKARGSVQVASRASQTLKRISFSRSQILELPISVHYLFCPTRHRPALHRFY